MKKKAFSKDEIDAVEAFERNERIKDREKKRRVLFIENVIEIAMMHETQQYKAILGYSPPPRWSGYLAQLELYYSRSEIDRWRRIVQKLVQEFGIPIEDLVLIPSTRLRDVMNIAKDAKEAEEYCDLAKHQTPSEWSETVRDAKGLPTPSTCKHGHNAKYEICEDCGQKNRLTP